MLRVQPWIARLKKVDQKPWFFVAMLLMGALSYQVILAVRHQPNFVAVHAQSSENPKTAPEQFIVKFKPESAARRSPGVSDVYFVRRQLESELRIESARKTFRKPSGIREKVARDTNVYTLKINTTKLVYTLERLKQNENVEFAQFNYAYEQDGVPNDARYTEQWAHTKTHATEAWDQSTGSSSVSIAVIGTGVKWDHEDLAANIWTNADEIAGNEVDDDLNGYIDDTRGWNFDLGDNNPTDAETHETSVAGVAAAVGNNGIGIAGVCWQCKIVPLRIDYETQQVADAIYYAINNGAKVINMSFGNYDPGKYGADTVVEDAVTAAVNNGILVVATAGNNSVTTKRYPAALDNVIAVASTDGADKRAGFSNWGEWVDVAAPGAGVLSTTPTGYASVSGTSFSAPYVSGVAALLFSRNPDISLSDMRNILEYSVDKIITDKPIPSGRLRADRSVSGISPELFAIIKKPWENYLLVADTSHDIWGTALGDSYVVEYMSVGGAQWTEIGRGGRTINGSLAKFTPPAGTFFSLRMTVTKGEASDSHVVNVGLGSGYLSGWPKNPGIGAILSAAQIADIDGNGDLELITGSNTGKVMVYNHDGTSMSGWPRTMPSPFIYGSVAVGDIDGDNKSDLVAASYGSSGGGGHASAWSSNGTIIPGWPKSIGQSRGAAVLANIDADPAMEVIVTHAGTGQVHVWNGDGSYVAGWPVTLTEANVQTSPAVGDVDGNGSNEVVVASQNKLHVLSATGQVLYSWARSGSHTSPVLADVDANGDLEIIIHGTGSLSVYEHSGIRRWARTTVQGDGYNKLSVANIAGDSRPEILFAATDGDNSRIYGWDNLGNSLSGWPVTAVGATSAEPTIGDINGDGATDLVLSTRAGRVYAWGSNGSLLSDFPKPVESSLYVAVALTDLNQDGKTDLVVGSEEGVITVWALGANHSNHLLPWPSALNNLQNTGVLDTVSPSTSVTSPINNSSVSGGAHTSITAAAADNRQVIKVEFYIDGVLRSTDNTSPYSMVWNTSAVSGAHTIKTLVYDAAGNGGTSSIVNVNVRDVTVPVVSITRPANNSLVVRGNTIDFDASASDNIGVLKVEFYAGSKLVCTDIAAPYNCKWTVPPTLLVSTYTLRAKAFDSAGNTKEHSVMVIAQ